ncbi:MFS transporter [Nocardioides sp. SYSU D00038]|uniref:MFS transporter n=1 Tax=Nocardioides sp. SYSU D00038 TaxID=2812554 RepID=UPI001968222B|nr:MFS transporter [Nocardioides sp. SYSU D00038]
MTTTLPEATPSDLHSRRGRLVLALVCAVAFLDFVDATIVNVALPAVRDDLDIPLQQLQWVPSGYLLTYGGFMLVGGRMADLLGRRRVLLAGLAVFGAASLVGGFAQSAEALVGARLVQGTGAALSLPAALSILTTTFTERADRHRALGVWGAVAGVSSAVGVLAGGVLTEIADWRWVMLVNPLLCALLVGPILALVPADRPRGPRGRFDLVGALLATAGMIVLVHALVEAPDRGWSAPRTVLELLAAAGLFVAFTEVERRAPEPLLPPSLLRLPGVAAANLVQLATFAGFLSLFFFVTVYMQDVLGYGPVRTGLAYVPSCLVAAASSAAAAQLIARLGTRPMVVGGSLTTALGLLLLSRLPADGSYAADLLPGLLVLSSGIGFVFVAVVAAGHAGVTEDRSGTAAALLNSGQQVGAALGLAVLLAVSDAVNDDELAAGATAAEALTDGFGRALLVGVGLLVAAAVVGLRTVNTHDPDPVA